MKKNILLAAATAILLLASPASAGFKVGDTISTNVFCTSVEAAKLLSTAIGTSGAVGFLAVIKEPQIPCYDFSQDPYIRLRNLTVVARLWAVNIPGPAGVTLRFYKLRGPKGKTYWSYNVER